MRRTKLIATLGPASGAPPLVREMLSAGVDVFRLNLSHGTQEEHAARIRTVRDASRDSTPSPAILLDLQGPKIRLGTFAGGRAALETGSRFTITTEPVVGTSERASTTYRGLPRDVKPGDRILLADGAVELRVLDSDGVSVHSEVVSGGAVGDRKGINLPGVRVSSPSLTEKDLADLEFGLRAGVDLVALSFVRSPADLRQLRSHLGRPPAAPPVIAKIEKPEAWENLDGILEEADGVMVARGDLGVEVALEKVPFIQKAIIEHARQYGKFSITATQMLESMVESPTPTRAEVSDVANAIYDGADAVMLSAETSVGRYPVEAVRMMARIAEETDRAVRERGLPEPPAPADPSSANIIADLAHHAAYRARAAAIVVFTRTGSTARLVARLRPPVPVYTFTPSHATALHLAPVYGVRTIVAPDLRSTDDMLSHLERVLVERKLLAPGDRVVFVAGQPLGRPGTTNLIKLHTVGEAPH